MEVTFHDFFFQAGEGMGQINSCYAEILLGCVCEK